MATHQEPKRLSAIPGSVRPATTHRSGWAWSFYSDDRGIDYSPDTHKTPELAAEDAYEYVSKLLSW